MLMLASGREACTDVQHLRGEPGLFGEVASDSTLYRTMRSIDAAILARLDGEVSRVRAHDPRTGPTTTTPHDHSHLDPHPATNQ